MNQTGFAAADLIAAVLCAVAVCVMIAAMILLKKKKKRKSLLFSPEKFKNQLTSPCCFC